MAEKNLQDLFLVGLKDIYFTERQILRGLTRMARAAEANELKQAFQRHREETEGQIERLQQVFELLGKRAQGKTCPVIQALIEEGEEIAEEFEDSAALDAGLVASAQAIEHYEIAKYGALKTWARNLGMNDAVKLLDQTLEEEKKTDALLTKLAEGQANQKAA